MASNKKSYEVNGMEAGEVYPKTSLLCSCRLTLTLIGFFMFFHLYAQRIGMSVAIVCMVNQTAIAEHAVFENDTKKSDAKCQAQMYSNTTSGKLKDGPFAWEKELQGHILGAFFYGYLVSQVPGGLLAERLGGKWVLAGSLGLSTIGTFLTPIGAKVSVIFLIFLRVLVGIGSGALFPAMHAMLGQWAPPAERTVICGLTYAGAFMGNVIALPVSGMLCENGFGDGWDSVFYVAGITTTICIILWCFLTSNSPTTHPRISDAEKNYIVSSLKESGSAEKKPTMTLNTWFKIFTSGPVWALIIANFCTDWGLYTYLTNIPTFYREVLYFDIQSNGLYSALPFLGLWANMNVTPIIADKLIEKKIFRPVIVRKLCNTIGLVGAGIFLIGLSFLDCSQTGLAVALLTIAVTISGCVYSGYFVNHMDIAPQYAGTLMGIANGLSASAGFIAPYIASVITKSQTRESWQIVFFIAAAVYAIGAILYCVLASGEVQPWARDTSTKMEDIDMKVVDNDDNVIYKPKSQTDVSKEPMLKNGGATPPSVDFKEPKASSNGDLPTDTMLAERT